MKKTIIMLLLFILAIVSCNLNNEEVTSLTNDAFSFTIEPDLTYDSTNERKLIMEKYDRDILSRIARTYDIKSQPLIKVSPKEIEDIFDIKIFHYDISGKSYLIYNNRAYQLSYYNPNFEGFTYYLNTDIEHKSSYGIYSYVIEGNKDNFTLYTINETVTQVCSQIIINKFESSDQTLYEFKGKYKANNQIEDFKYSLFTFYSSGKIVKDSYGLLMFNVKDDEINIYGIIDKYISSPWESDKGRIPYEFKPIPNFDDKFDYDIHNFEFETKDDQLFYDKETGKPLITPLYK